MPAPSAARTVSRLSFSLSDQAVPRPSLPREGRQFANMPVAAATAQANADARSEAKAFAKENVHGIQPSSHGFTTLMLALFAILTDVTDDFVPALLLLNHVTTQIPLASILRNSRYLDVDMGAFHAGGGGAAAGGGGHAQVQAGYLDPMFGADNAHTWHMVNHHGNCREPDILPHSRHQAPTSHPRFSRSIL